MPKILVVKFSFVIEEDEFGLHVLAPEVLSWLRQGMSDAEALPNATVTIEPLADAPSPGGLVAVRKRTRGPNKPKYAGAQEQIAPRVAVEAEDERRAA